MSSTDVGSESATAGAPPKPGEVKLEVVPVPVSDVDDIEAAREDLIGPGET